MQITARNLTKRYGSKVAVDDVSFTVREGQVTGFLGPNGAGKSTTLRLLLGLHRPDAGRVLVDDRPLAAYPNPLQVVGSVLDAKAFNPRNTPLQHLLAQAATHGLGLPRVEELLAVTGLAGVAGKPIGTFSLGMSQRLGIANALVGDPQILLLDEPINGLDPEGVRWVRDTVRGLAAEGRTVLLSSHLMGEMAQTADHIIVIGRGRILADAPVAEIVANAGGGATRVRSPQVDDLMGRLAERDVQVETVDPLTRIVSGVGAEEIGRVAARHRLVLFELSPLRSSLEDAYLDLTADAVEYRTGIAA
ncbi:ABC transporter ATP-binding protein [Propionicicella superfundia]|uniref:ABC transporter ATP-binding protein n=1 Tax=Propionicicella superfundia TaxID=348582 RepID=UPI0003FE3F6F|nr:ATP-binding cassette domain-containing protein [Propionicicella superfundia]